MRELVHVAGVQQWGSCCSKAALEINPDMMFHFAETMQKMIINYADQLNECGKL